MRKEDLYTTTIQGLPVASTSLINHHFQIHIVYLSLVLRWLKARLVDGNGVYYAKDGDETSLQKLLCVIQCFLTD